MVGGDLIFGDALCDCNQSRGRPFWAISRDRIGASGPPPGVAKLGKDGRPPNALPRAKLQLKANRRTAEYRISNVEVWNRFAKSFLKLTVRQIKSSRQAEYIIRCSMLDVRC